MENIENESEDVENTNNLFEVGSLICCGNSNFWSPHGSIPTETKTQRKHNKKGLDKQSEGLRFQFQGFNV